ncbi:MAG: YicC family protein [Clostridia bacterium]|nr:YicC family protein [Clostridia bacterium]MBQ2153298.1 YicC family protein [Clostridia bacterium]
MVRSMTGYGRSETTGSVRDISVEMKSVNHRYFEVNTRVTRGYGFIEDRLKKYLQTKISRGKVDVYVSIGLAEDEEADVTVNHNLAKGYINALRELGSVYGLPDDITITSVAKYSDIFSVHKKAEDEEKVWSEVKPVLDEALNDFLNMREAEGERLKADVMSRAETILSIVKEIEERSPQTVIEYKQKLTERINELLENAAVDEQRIATEAAIFADKIAVDEETVRLRSHFEQMKEIFAKGGAIGRKLDFIVQEMNREANTIGSKVTDAQLAHKVVDIKAEIEKIREQIQNIE